MSRSTRAFFAAGLLALIGAAALHLLVLAGVGRVWPALVHLTLFGWITGLIYAVNYHTMPVFAARDFPDARLIWLHLGAFAGGVALATMGLLLRSTASVTFGLLLELAAALAFTANTVLLFTHGPRRAARSPAPAIAGQPRVDKVGTQATKAAGLCLPLALLLLLLVQVGRVGYGWMLAAEHLAALGWVMLMIVGVAYHVLPRFSGHGTRGPAWVRLQLAVHLAALALIVAGLGFNWPLVFALGGLLMSGAIGLFAWAIWPTLRAVRARSPLVQVTLKERPQ